MTTPPKPVVPDAPISNFTNCHSGILKRLNALDELPALLEPAARARQIAEQSLEFFREAIFEHHLEEERELFPAVIASAQPGVSPGFTARRRSPTSTAWSPSTPPTRALKKPNFCRCRKPSSAATATTWPRSACRCTCGM